MQINVEKSEGCKRVIRVEIPAKTVSEKFSESYRDINKQVQLPGFRKGKAPRPVLEKRFGAEVAGDVRQNLADEALRKAVDEHALKVLGQPEVIEGGDFKSGADAVLVIEAEVHPEFELPQYKGIELERPDPKVTDQEVLSVIRSDQMGRGELKTVEGEAGKDHVLRCSIVVTCEGEELLRRERGLLEVGYGYVAGLKPDDGEKALLGLKAGETRKLKATLPEDFPRVELRGKVAEIEVECIEVASYEGPTLEEVAKDRGYESLDAWKEDVKGKLQAERESEIDAMVEQQALKKVADAIEMELPEKFSKRRRDELIQQQAYRMYQAGIPEEEIRAYLEKSRDNEQELDDVKGMLKRAFVLDAIARTERLVVTEEDVRREIEKLAERVGQSPEAVANILNEQGRLSGLREELKTNKVMKLLRQKAKYV